MRFVGSLTITQRRGIPPGFLSDPFAKAPLLGVTWVTWTAAAVPGVVRQLACRSAHATHPRPSLQQRSGPVQEMGRAMEG